VLATSEQTNSERSNERATLEDLDITLLSFQYMPIGGAQKWMRPAIGHGDERVLAVACELTAR
jgi:hypothetical protein